MGGETVKREGQGGRAYALLALAATKAFIMWKSSSFIWPIITDGEYTPAAVTAAPKRAPDATDLTGEGGIPAMLLGCRLGDALHEGGRSNFLPAAKEISIYRGESLGRARTAALIQQRKAG